LLCIGFHAGSNSRGGKKRQTKQQRKKLPKAVGARIVKVKKRDNGGLGA